MKRAKRATTAKWRSPPGSPTTWRAAAVRSATGNALAFGHHKNCLGAPLVFYAWVFWLCSSDLLSGSVMEFASLLVHHWLFVPFYRDQFKLPHCVLVIHMRNVAFAFTCNSSWIKYIADLFAPTRLAHSPLIAVQQLGSSSFIRLSLYRCYKVCFVASCCGWMGNKKFHESLCGQNKPY